MKIALFSDVHFGRIAHPDIVEALVRDIRAAAPDLVVVAGDLTQRARKRELRAAKQLIGDVGASIVIPGNHDVFAWWFPFRRLVTPLARYRAMISEEVDLELSQDGLALLALNTSHGWTVKSGRLVAPQLSRAKAFFNETRDAEKKVLVVHHHLVSLPESFGKHDIVRQGRVLFELALDWGVDVILSGHLHQSHAQIVGEGTRTTVLVSSGTATSDRGRRADVGRNIYEMITLDRGRLSVRERLFSIPNREFEQARTFSFEKTVEDGKNQRWSPLD